MPRVQMREYPSDFIAVSPQYTILELDRETVMYRTGSRHIAFVGELYVELAALVDGTLTRDDIVALLCQRFDDTSVEHAVDELLTKDLARYVNRVTPSFAESTFNVQSPTVADIHSKDSTLAGNGDSPRIEYDRDGVLKPPSTAGETTGEPKAPSGPISDSGSSSPVSGSRNDAPAANPAATETESGERQGATGPERIHRALGANIRFTGNETRIRTSYANLKQDAIHPLRLLGVDGFSLRTPIDPNTDQETQSLANTASDENRTLDWTSAWSMRQRRLVFVPTGLIYRNHVDFDLESTGTASPGNPGCGAGMTFDEAIFQASYDLIKRDAAALWWNNRIVRPGVNSDAIEDKEVPSALLRGGGTGRKIELLDLTTDIGIPVIAAVSADADDRRIAIGLGCHINPANAVYAALEDHDAAVRAVTASESPWSKENLHDHPFLKPEGTRGLPRGRPAMMPAVRIKKICLAAIERIANDVIVANLSRPDTAIPCVKILAPGLCDVGMNFAIDRLGYGPVAAGWADTPSDTMGCNPMPYPFP